ncbi:MAG: cold shock domain-containing protein [Actinomycetia bacterium]|nr:cold shock domain-containing protein [Actinomycetes bacterium]MCP3911874.1 cold shock domain-containing protein [Actinomycetes bacterium]
MTGRGRGVVASFDEQAGRGTVRGDDGVELYFHCTAIADGTRSIDEGDTVSFEVEAGAPGVWEAAHLTKLAG